jgi:Phosphotransferase enzyme family
MTALRSWTDEDALRECLERLAPNLCGRPAVVVGFERRPSDYASSYAAEIVTLRLKTGQEVKVFIKNLGVSQVPKDGAEHRRERERAVYRDLLAEADLGAPRYYGSVWDEARGRYWLLLEFVEGVPVRCCDLGGWESAAGWLGRLHGHFANQAERLRGCEFLARHDTDFFRSRAEQALREVSQVSRPLAGRLAGVLSHYDRLVDELAAPPCTLVHGNYRPANILVAPGPGAGRVCPVDWEQAGWGSPLYDLAYLSDGFAPPELDRLLEAYRRQHPRRVAVPDLEGLRHLVVCFHLFMAINRLSRAGERGFPEHKVAKTVARAEELSRRAAGGGGLSE